MESLVIYFSRDGSTRIVADLVAEKLKAEIVELQEKKPRRNFIVSGYRSAKGVKPDLAGDPWAAMEGKDLVVLGAPIWAGNGNPVLNSFLEKAEFKGKKVLVFTLQADPGTKTSEKVVVFLSEKIASAGGEIVGSFGFHGSSPGKTAKKEYLEEQFANWDLPVD